MILSEYLKQRSKEICSLLQCTEDEHKCGSYAYVRADMRLIDICLPDYFQGCSGPYAAIPLPWDGTEAELAEEVAEQCSGGGE